MGHLLLQDQKIPTAILQLIDVIIGTGLHK